MLTLFFSRAELYQAQPLFEQKLPEGATVKR